MHSESLDAAAKNQPSFSPGVCKKREKEEQSASLRPELSPDKNPEGIFGGRAFKKREKQRLLQKRVCIQYAYNTHTIRIYHVK